MKLSARQSSGSKLLNLGCGRQFHADWVNVDIDAIHRDVVSHDITTGVPFATDSFDAIYHSHVLEHLDPDQGEALIAECFRALKPGGVLRIVVPDLERIALLYLDMHQHAWEGNEEASVNYNWMKLELLDQLVRAKSGGRMGQYMSQAKIKNSEFVRERVGDELSICQSYVPDAHVQELSWSQRLQRKTLRWRTWLAKRCVRYLLGRKAKAAFTEGFFRSQGEVHRWMYDRYSLRDLCQRYGFEEFRVCQANESSIRDFNLFQLDQVEGRVRKPDSIFIECCKPVDAVAATANYFEDDLGVPALHSKAQWDSTTSWELGTETV